MKKILTSFLFFFLALPAAGLNDSTSIYLKQHIGYLASDALEGRKAGSKGAELAAEYIAQQFQSVGLVPLGDHGSYFQHFSFISGVRLGEKNSLSRSDGKGTTSYQLNRDFRPLAFSADGQVSGPVIFAGYGISSTDPQYDDYANVDVKNKIVLVMRYSPENDNPHSEFGKYLPLRYKTLTAREKGAKALLVVTGSADDSTDELIALRYDNSFSNSGLPVFSVSRAVADSWLRAAHTTVDSLQTQINTLKKPASIDIPNVVLSLSSDVVEIKDSSANVAGLLKLDGTQSDEYLVIGAHYDHLGWGGEGSGSLAPDKHEIHNGADDNASGTGGVIELARLLSHQKASLKRNILLISFSGEEEGLLGSEYYVKHPLLPLNNAVAMINLDMVGRLKDRTLTVQGTGTSSRWDALVGAYNADSTIILKSVKDGYGPSDHSSFYGANIPVLFFFTGIHEDYHKPSDHADKINYDGEALVLDYIRRIAIDIDDHTPRPDYLKTSSSSNSESRGFRVYVGTVPDYSDQSNGMKITAVRDNSPAAKAGLLGGDIIVKFGKFEIKNVYDYTYALQEYKPGDEVEVVVQRGNEKIVKNVKLEKRN